MFSILIWSANPWQNSASHPAAHHHQDGRAGTKPESLFRSHLVAKKRSRAGRRCLWQTTADNRTGNGSVAYAVGANPTSFARSGSISIGGQPFLLTQSGARGTNATRLRFLGRTTTNATLSVQGEAGKMYVVEGSEDLINWQPISTNPAPATVTATTLGNPPQRFYRTVEVP